MGKTLRLSINREEELSKIGKALSSPERIRILNVLQNGSKTIAEIARDLGFPASSTKMHINILKDADLIRIEQMPGTRGNSKLCIRTTDKINIRLSENENFANNVISVEMPIGSYTECHVTPTCGLADENGIIGDDDQELDFYLPERIKAQMLWTSSGYVEYMFPNQLMSLPFHVVPRELSVSLEICSEVSGYNESWKSDITMMINGCDIGTWTSPGDFGARRGRNNPMTWYGGRTQYGLLTTWKVNESGGFVNNRMVSRTNLNSLSLMDHQGIRVWIGNLDDALNKGGFNIFGRKFGDYTQDIILTIAYQIQ